MQMSFPAESGGETFPSPPRSGDFRRSKSRGLRKSGQLETGLRRCVVEIDDSIRADQAFIEELRRATHSKLLEKLRG